MQVCIFTLVNKTARLRPPGLYAAPAAAQRGTPAHLHSNMNLHGICWHETLYLLFNIPGVSLGNREGEGVVFISLFVSRRRCGASRPFHRRLVLLRNSLCPASRPCRPGPWPSCASSRRCVSPARAAHCTRVKPPSVIQSAVCRAHTPMSLQCVRVKKQATLCTRSSLFFLPFFFFLLLFFSFFAELVGAKVNAALRYTVAAK